MSPDPNNNDLAGHSSCLKRLLTIAGIGLILGVCGLVLAALGIFQAFIGDQSSQEMAEAQMTLQAEQLGVAIRQSELLLTQVALQMTAVYFEVTDPYDAAATLQALDATRGVELVKISIARSTLTPNHIYPGGPGYGEYRNPITVKWVGNPEKQYRVTLKHLSSGKVFQSGWMSTQSWEILPPLDGTLFGEWEWYVEDDSGQKSSPDKFVFDPYLGREVKEVNVREEITPAIGESPEPGIEANFPTSSPSPTSRPNTGQVETPTLPVVSTPSPIAVFTDTATPIPLMPTSTNTLTPYLPQATPIPTGYVGDNLPTSVNTPYP